MNRAVALALGVALAAALGGPARALEEQEAAWSRLLDAKDTPAALEAAAALADAGVEVGIALERLRKGRTYQAQPAGTSTFTFTASDKTALETLVDVPQGYTPDRRWPVRVQLHGGVGRPADAPRSLTPNRIQGESAIYLQPKAHARAEWWHLNQYEHLVALLDWTKLTYNVDENRVYVTGISDGATGAYFLAMKWTTPFSAFLPLNGNMRVLATPATRANGQLYAGNLVNKPLFVVNGGRDPLYPAASVEPHLAMIRAAGGTVEYRPQPDAGHDTAWWPDERARFEGFTQAHPREPHPRSISWESERTDRYNRAHWMVINHLGRRGGDATSLMDVNRFTGEGGEQRMFARVWPSGRVDATRDGNRVEVRSRGVTAFTLLLSPDAVDFERPIVVEVNGIVTFDGVVKPDARTLLEWYARDRDRTMIYTAALRVEPR